MDSKNGKITVMLVDDHALVRDGIKALLEDEEDIIVIQEASQGLEAIDLLQSNEPDLMIIDIKMPKMNGIELVSQLTKSQLPIKYLMLSMHDSEEYVLQSIEAGAHGYLLKDASREEFMKAIHTVSGDGMYFSGDISKYLVKRFHRSEPTINQQKPPSNQSTEINPASLTKRELQILHLAASGKSNNEIAEALGKSKRTVEVHRFNLMKKIGSKNLAELINKSKDMGYL